MTYHTPTPRPYRHDLPVSAHVSVTLRLAKHEDDLLVRHIRLLRDCVALSQQRWQFEIDAAAVLPSELHLLCSFVDAKFAVGGAIKLITTAFERHVPTARGQIWASDNEVVEISSAVAALRKDFIEDAPVRAGLVQSARDWPYSSANAGGVQSDEFGTAVA